MNYINLDSLVSDTSNFNKHIQGQSQNDSATYNISITDSNLTDFKIRSSNVNMITMDGNGVVNFATSSNSPAATLRVNQRDMSSWNMWYQYGTVGLETKFNFVRVRWEGQAYYASSYDNAAGKLIFNVILLSNHSIYLIIEKWPTSNATGTNTFYCNGNTITYSPSTTNLKFCFVPSNANGTSWSLMSEYTEPKFVELLKYFIKDGTGKLYSLVDESLTEISEMTEENGMDSLPSYDVYKNLTDPSILILSSYDQVNPEAKEKYMPDHIDYETEDYICDFKINRVWITADTSTKIQMSFDGGTTWEHYSNGSWVTDSDLTTGNTKAEIHDIPMAQWQEKNTSGKIKFRCSFVTTDQHVDKIEIGNQDSYEGAYGEVCPY